MTVASLDSLVNSLAHLARGGLPGTESQQTGAVLACTMERQQYKNLRDLSAGVESDFLSKRHEVDMKWIDDDEQRQNESEEEEAKNIKAKMASLTPPLACLFG